MISLPLYTALPHHLTTIKCITVSSSGWLSSRKFCQRGSNSDNVSFFSFFHMMRGEWIQMPLKVGHYDGPTLNAGFVLFRGILTSIANIPYSFVICRGAGGGGSRAYLSPAYIILVIRKRRCQNKFLWLFGP